MTNPFHQEFPVDEALPPLKQALAEGRSAVLVAPPGAGKTTRVPLALLDEPWTAGRKILVLEPRRLAARAAAGFIAKSIGEQAGETVGFRVRFGSKISKKTRIEFVTEGVFTRMVLDDPELSGIAAVLFDEFHERSMDADLGLALALDAQRGLREDLRIVAMSATIDGARVAKLMGDAPVIESKGRAFPVETKYLGRDPRTHIERQVADAVVRAVEANEGSVLAFLPGAAEIRRTAEQLNERIRDTGIDIVPLYGALDAEVQDRAISPAPNGKRKIVLATSIAETSLTIEGVRIVVDSGLARVPKYEPALGLTRLETVRVSRASADQRRGRAGRTEPGVAYRLWTEPETQALIPFATPEILESDLSGLILDLAVWGVNDPAKLAWLDPPPAPAIAEARSLLRELDALDADGRVTSRGKRIAKLPLPPRLAAMIVGAAAQDEALLAAEIAAVISERNLGGDDLDLSHRVEMFRRDRSRRGEEARRLARNWAEQAGGKQRESAVSHVGKLLALAFPDRIAKARAGKPGEFLLVNGRGAKLDAAHSFAREKYLAVAEITGRAGEGRILLAAKISEQEIESEFASHIEDATDFAFDEKSASLRARKVRRLGAISLSEKPLSIETGLESAEALAEGIARLGMERLPWSAHQKQLLERVRYLREQNGEDSSNPWPDLSGDNLIASVKDWLAPALMQRTALSQINADDLANALHHLLPHELMRRLEKDAPTHFTAPTGSNIPIDYAAEQGPTVQLRVQELFGLDQHPKIANGKVALILSLTSPAGRPIQVTRLLARLVGGCPPRHARTLSETSLAGRSACRRAHKAGEAARYVKFERIH